jgi:hypothetical protein
MPYISLPLCGELDHNQQPKSRPMKPLPRFKQEEKQQDPIPPITLFYQLCAVTVVILIINISLIIFDYDRYTVIFHLFYGWYIINFTLYALPKNTEHPMTWRLLGRILFKGELPIHTSSESNTTDTEKRQ